MISNEKSSLDLTGDSPTNGGYTVRFDDRVYTDADASRTSDGTISTTDPPSSNPPVQREGYRRRHRSGILKRRENTLTTPEAPPIILSDEGLKAGRVSPFINFRLFLSMTVRSIGIVFGDMYVSLIVLFDLFENCFLVEHLPCTY